MAHFQLPVPTPLFLLHQCPSASLHSLTPSLLSPIEHFPSHYILSCFCTIPIVALYEKERETYIQTAPWSHSAYFSVRMLYGSRISIHLIIHCRTSRLILKYLIPPLTIFLLHFDRIHPMRILAWNCLDLHLSPFLSPLFFPTALTTKTLLVGCTVSLFLPTSHLVERRESILERESSSKRLERRSQKERIAIYNSVWSAHFPLSLHSILSRFGSIISTYVHLSDFKKVDFVNFQKKKFPENVNAISQPHITRNING